MKNFTTHHLVKLAFMAALSLVFMAFEFPLPGTGLQFDLSDFPVIVTGSIFGFFPAVLVALIKNIAHLTFATRNANIAGEIANFTFAILLALPVSLIKGRELKHNIMIAVITVIFASFTMNFFNYYVTFPLYGLPQEGAWDIILSVYMPFNIIKSSILMILYILTQPYLHRLIKK